MDPVRYISNRSSGKIGYTIAEAALDAGHDVVLISGPVNLAPPRNTKFISVSTSDEMFEAVNRHAREWKISTLVETEMNLVLRGGGRVDRKRRSLNSSH